MVEVQAINSLILKLITLLFFKKKELNYFLVIQMCTYFPESLLLCLM